MKILKIDKNIYHSHSLKNTHYLEEKKNVHPRFSHTQLQTSTQKF